MPRICRTSRWAAYLVTEFSARSGCRSVSLGDALLDAFRKDCEAAIIVSNDADLKTPIELTMNEFGIRVGVLNPHPPERRSLDLRPTFVKQLRRGPIEASQFEPVLHDEQGEIRRPEGW